MSDSVGHHQRGQSELLGIILLFALVITVSLTVVVVGSSAISDVQSNTMTESAEHTMLELQAAAAGSSGGVHEISFAESEGARPASSQAVGAGSRAENIGSVAVDDSSGSINIRITDSSGALLASKTISDLGKIEYERDGELLAYQAGGIFRKNVNSDSSSIVSPPNFVYQYRNGVPTLSMAITTVQGEATNNEITLTQQSASRIFPTSSAANPIQSGHTVTITVESEYYQAWGNLFRQRTDGTVRADDFDGDGIGEARLQLSGPPSNNPLSSSAVSSSYQPELVGPNQASIDSYSSDTQTYGRNNGPLIVRGDFKQQNHFELHGSLYVSERAYIDVQAASGGFIEQNVYIHGDPTNSEDSIIQGKTTISGSVHSEDTMKFRGGGHAVTIEGDVFVGAEGTSTGIETFRETTVEGSVHVQGDMPYPGSGASIQGDLYVEGSVDESQWDPHVAGTIHEGSDVATPADPKPLPPITNLDGTIDTYEDNHDDPSEHDNAEHPVDVGRIQSGNCGTGANACELTGASGGRNYYLPGGIDVRKDETLILDTSSGPINIYAGPNANGDNGIYLKGGTIRVEGNNGVTVYSDGDLQFEWGEIVTSPVDHRAENFVVYMRTHDHSGAQNVMNILSNGAGKPADYTGVFLSPDATEGGLVRINGKAEVYGSLMGEVTNIANGAAIHFDEALLDGRDTGGPAGGGADSIAYLQLTERVIEIT